MDPVSEMRELERLWQESPHSNEFIQRQRCSKWGERIREEVIEKIRAKQQEAIEDGILYLVTSPRYHRSGYHKARIASALKSARLTSTQTERLRRVILNAVDCRRVGPEFSEYARLAIVVANAEFIVELKHGVNTEQPWARSRRDRLLALCEKHITTTNKE